MPRKNPSSTKNTVGRDNIVSAGDGSLVIGGDVRNSHIVHKADHRVDATSKFVLIYEQVENRSDLSAADKTDLRSELQSFEGEDKKGPEANEGFLAQRLRNVRRIAPDMVDVAIATIANPAAGFGMIAKKVAEKMKVENLKAETR